MFTGQREKLHPDAEAAEKMRGYIGGCRQVYNLALEQRLMAHKLFDENVSRADQNKYLKELRDDNDLAPWLAEVPSQVLQSALVDVDTAFQNFWKHDFGFPKFHAKHYAKNSFRVPQHVRVRRASKRRGEVQIPKIGWVSFVWTRAIPGRIKNCTVTLEPDGTWWVGFQCEKRDRPVAEKNKSPRNAGVGGGPHVLPVGAWTDDTSMALCLADSLLECRGFDSLDQLDKYRRWYRGGYRSSTGECFDIGNQTCDAIERFETTGDAFPGLHGAPAPSNGSLMRLAPIPMAYAGNRSAAIGYAALSSMVTHGNVEAVDACRYYASLIHAALAGVGAEELLRRGGYRLGLDDWAGGVLHPNVLSVAIGSYVGVEPPVIQGSGYVIKSLEAAMWAVHTTDSFRDAVLAASNLGDDADTTAAVAGQLAGAVYGVEGIPANWIEALHDSEGIGDVSRRLYAMSLLAGA